MYEFKGMGVRIVREKPPDGAGATITRPDEAIEVIQEELKSECREVVVSIILDSRHKVLGIALVGVGITNAALIHPREIFLPSICFGFSTAIIVCHNHPTGDISASKEDIETAKRLHQVGELIGIEMLDFLIIGPRTFLSLKENNHF